MFQRFFFNDGDNSPVRALPTALRTILCGMCWGQRAIIEPIKIDGITVMYVNVICVTCDGTGYLPG